MALTKDTRETLYSRYPEFKRMIDALWHTDPLLYDEMINEQGATEGEYKWTKNISTDDTRMAVALGHGHELYGNLSTVLGGYGSITRSYRETILGSYAEDLAGTADAWVATDRLLGIGNGADADNRNDAFRMYKSGYSVYKNAVRFGAFDWGENLPESGAMQYTLSNGFQGYHNAAWKRFAFIDPAAADTKLTYYDSLTGQLKTSGVSRVDLETHLSGIPYSSRSVATGVGQILSNFTSDAMGHVTGIALRSLVDTDIPGTIARTSQLHSAVTLGTANGLSLSGQQLSLGLSSESTTGALSSTDWNTFNSKQAAYTNLTSIGNLANASGFLKNNGSGTFSYTFPTFSEITSKPTTLAGYGITDAAPANGSGNYIQNQFSSAQDAAFYITRYDEVAGKMTRTGSFGEILRFSREGLTGYSGIGTGNSSESALGFYSNGLLVGTIDNTSLTATKFIPTANNSDVVYDYANSFMYAGLGGYNILRQGTDRSFNIDTYNGNNPVNALKLSQTGNLTAAGTGKFVGLQSEKRGLYSSISNMISTSALFLSNSTYSDYGLAIGVNNSHAAIQSMYLNNFYKLAINPFGGRLLIGTNADNGVDAVQVAGSILSNKAGNAVGFEWGDGTFRGGLTKDISTGYIGLGTLSSHDLRLFVDYTSTRGLIIKSSTGNILANTSTDNIVDKLQVSGSAFIGGDLTLRSNGETSLMINSISNSPVVRLSKNSVLKWGILAEYPSSGQLTFYDYTSGASRLTLGSTGITIYGSNTATSFIKSGGTSSQFLKADGSVDSNTYLTSFTETDPIFTAHTSYNIVNGAGFLKNNGTGTWSYDNNSYSLSSHNHSGVYEPVISKSTGYVYWNGTQWVFLNASYDNYVYWYVSTNGTTRQYIYSGNNLNFAAGTGIDVSYSSGTITISATGGSMVYPDAGIPLSTGSGWGTSIANNSANWNTAYSWGNHAGLYEPFIPKTGSGYLYWDGSQYLWSIPQVGPGGVYGSIQYNNSGTLGGFGSWNGNTFAVGGDVSASNLTLTGNLYSAEGYRGGSSRTLKENIQDMARSGLDIINSLQIKTFNYRGSGLFGVNFIAEETDPWLSGPDRKQHIYQNHLGVLSKAVQEEDTQLQALKREVAELKQKLREHGIQQFCNRGLVGG